MAKTSSQSPTYNSAVQERHLPTITPLTARSVAISTLLGYHPPALQVSTLVRIGGLFGISERATRVALTRMTADGDATADGGVYQLTERLLQRQREQDEASSPSTKPWHDSWELAVVTTAARPLPERVAMRRTMIDLRLAELREGVWIRPDNLIRQPDPAITTQCTFFEAHYPDPTALAATLWDLPAWAKEAERLLDLLTSADDLKSGFLTIAATIRHLQLDPLLPAELLPQDWPGDKLRDHNHHFTTTFARRLREYAET